MDNAYRKSVEVYLSKELKSVLGERHISFGG
jgi:hypothetical protein